jgi:hypothetical protein
MYCIMAIGAAPEKGTTLTAATKSNSMLSCDQQYGGYHAFHATANQSRHVDNYTVIHAPPSTLHQGMHTAFLLTPFALQSQQRHCF